MLEVLLPVRNFRVGQGQVRVHLFDCFAPTDAGRFAEVGERVDVVGYAGPLCSWVIVGVVHRDHFAVVAAKVGEVSLVLGSAVGAATGGAEVEVLVIFGVPEVLALVEGWDWVFAAVGLGAG
jgi:hypothetical protein